MSSSDRFGLPRKVSTCLFDLDGVLTETAKVHAAAWKEMFDGFLRRRGAAGGGQFDAFDETLDYDTYVDGKPRLDGTRSFLEARGISLPEGASSDATGTDTVYGLSNAKNEIVTQMIARDGVEAYPGSVSYLRAVLKGGLHRGVVSSSANCAAVLKSAGIADFFEARVDGLTVRREKLEGKPAPDTFLAAAKLLGVEPGEAAVFEDALAGVEAGRSGRFGFVVGVDRVGQAEALKAHGADIVVADLSELLHEM